jgi:Protein of unknown function (DUF2975)
MSEAAGPGQAPPFIATSLRANLRARIAWICQALRIAAVVWAIWELVFVAIHWSDNAQILQNYERVFATTLTVSTARYAVAFALVMVSIAVAAVIAFCIWRLAGTYLAGHVFTVDAALWLRRTGVAGLAGLVISVLARVAVASILTGQWVPKSALGFYYILPMDVLHLIFVTFLLALAHIFKAAAEMADDRAQIV